MRGRPCSPRWRRTSPPSASSASPRPRPGRSRRCPRRRAPSPSSNGARCTPSRGRAPSAAARSTTSGSASAPRRPTPFYIASSPERIAGQRLVWRGEIGAARAILSRQLVEADERGEPSSYALQRLHLCELELRAGEWDAAERRLDEWAESADRELLHWPMYERCRALLAAGRGLPDEARRWGTEADARASSSGVRWDQLEAQRALGTAELLGHDTAAAATRLRTVWEHTEREGVCDPGAFPVAPGARRGPRRAGRAGRGGRRRRPRRGARGAAGSSVGSRHRAAVRGPDGARARVRRRGRDVARAGRRRVRAPRPRASTRPGRCSPSAAPNGATGSGAQRARRSNGRRRRSTSSARRAGPRRRAPSSIASARAGRRRRGS